MRQVLDPLKVRHRHPACVGIHIGDDQRALAAQDVIGTKGHRAIGRLDDQGRLDARGIAKVDDTLQRGGNEDVAFHFQHRRTIRYMAALGIPCQQPAIAVHVLAQVFDVDALVIQDRAIAFDDGDDPRAILFGQELGGVIAHIAKTLHDHALTLQIAGQAGGGAVLGVAEELAQRELHAPARRLDPALDATCMGRLAGHTGFGVDVGGVHARILVGDPRHFALARPHVRGGHILRRVDQVALDQLIGKAAGDLF